MMLKRMVCLLLALFMLLGMTACAGSAGEPAAPAENAGTGAEAAAPAASKKTEGGEKILRIAQNGTPETLGMLRSDGYGTAITQNLSDALTRINDKFELEPGLATSWEWIDENTWQFKIREGVSFINGEKLDAETVAYNLNSLTDRELKYAFISHWGAAWPIKAEAVDEYTLNVITSQPNAYVPNLLTRLVIYDDKQWQEEGDETYFMHPAGTGPYEVESWDMGIQLVLKKADIDYWDGTTAYFDKVILDCVTNDSSRISALQAGEYDIVEEIPYDQVTRLQEASKDYVINIYETVGVNWMFFNGYTPEDNIVHDINFRKAVAHAIDQEAINEVLFGGICSVRQGVSPDIAFGGDAGTKAYAYDTELAKKCLAESAYAGQKVYFYMSEGEFSNDIVAAEYITASLNAIGINVEVQQLDPTICDEKRKGGEGEFYMINTPGSFGGMSDYYWNQMNAKRGYTSSDFDEVKAIFEASRAYGLTDDERRDLLREGNAKLWELVPVLASWADFMPLGMNAELKGVRFAPNSWLYFKNAYYE